MIAFSIFLLTLILVIWQPRGLGIGWSASFGAALMLLTGIVPWQDIVVVWHLVWNATATFIALIIISLILDAAGFFTWCALHIARWGQGRTHRLFSLLILLGALVAAVFANDGAALILTPIVLGILHALRFGPQTLLAFVIAAVFIADAGSLPLVVSNLVNIFVADYFRIGFNAYWHIMAVTGAITVLAAWAVLYLYFRRDLPVHYDVTQLTAPITAIQDRATFQTGWVVLIGLLIALVIAEPLGVPVSALAGLAALILMIVAARGETIAVRPIIRRAPWQIVTFSLGMYLVVYGLRHAGLTAYLADALNWFAQQGLWAATFGTGFLMAALSSVMNNMPAVLAGTLAIDQTDLQGPVKTAMIYANIIGCDLGPKLTPIGSLATLLWLHVLKQKGIVITWGQYCRVGVVLTLPVLLVSLLALGLRLGHPILS